MPLSDACLGILAFLAWVLIAIPVGVVLGMAIHQVNNDIDGPLASSPIVNRP